MSNNLISKTSKRLPIVLCLDISPSMSTNNRIENLNEAIKLFYNELSRDQKVINSAEVAIITFSTNIEENTDFETIDYIDGKSFTVVEHGGTNLSTAVLTSIKKIEDRLVELDDSGIDNYIPFLVLVTDGDPDKTDDQENLEKAINSVLKHCDTNSFSSCLIAPYIIGVGDEIDKNELDRFAEKFTGSAIIIDGDECYQQTLFEELFTFISNSVKNSLRGAENLKCLFESIQKQAKKQTSKHFFKKRN